jgi:hypothetical protein
MKSMVNVNEAVENVKRLLRANNYYDIKVRNNIKPDLQWEVESNILELAIKQILLNSSFNQAETCISDLSVGEHQKDTLIIQTLKKSSKNITVSGIPKRKCLSDDFAECYILTKLMTKLGAKMEFQNDSDQTCVLLKVPVRSE